MRAVSKSIIVLMCANVVALVSHRDGRSTSPSSSTRSTSTSAKAGAALTTSPGNGRQAAGPTGAPAGLPSTTPARRPDPTASTGSRPDALPKSDPEPTTTPPSGSYPEPGTVGYRGAVTDLHVIDGAGSAPPGTSWNSEFGFLQVNADEVTIDGAYVRGGVDFHGRGTLNIRNSIVEGGYGTWFVVLGRTAGSTVDVRDSTLRWRAGSVPYGGIGNGAIQVQASLRMIAVRNDISGMPDGIQLAGSGSRIEQNWIHDLAVLGQYPDNTHNDGIQMYDGDGVVIAGNRIEIGFNGTHQNAAVFVQPGDGNNVRGLHVVGNYLEGGGFTFRLEKPVTTGAVVRDNVFGPLPAAAFGFVSVTGGAAVAEWSGNRRADGGAVAPP